MTRKHRPLEYFSLFSEKSLTLLISIVTLLLQLISFATTWNGAKIYLEDIFPFASLLFALAIQATAYFFSNSLRRRISPLKVVALCIALCCSTSYSYIGIYNSVNSPAIYLQERYLQISRQLESICDARTEATLNDAREEVNTASSLIISRYSALTSEKENIRACRSALSEVQTTYTSGLRAPKQSSYETYEEYAAVYQAYISSASSGSGLENQASREQQLAAYGYTSMEQLNQAEADNTAALATLRAALGSGLIGSTAGENTETAGTDSAMATDTDSASTGSTDSAALTAGVSSLSAGLIRAINQTDSGTPLSAADKSDMNQLFQAAALCGYEDSGQSEINRMLELCAQLNAEPLLSTYTDLIQTLPEQTVTDANIMDLKASMDGAIMSAMINLNTLLPKEQQLSYTAAEYQITDLYLVPVEALKATDTRTTAGFCLLVAALIDALSVLFALSIKPRKALWKKPWLTGSMEDFQPYIYAALPANTVVGDAACPTPARKLHQFLEHFQPSPHTEADGYMLCCRLNQLNHYNTLTALLCQLNLARILPAGYRDNEEDLLLLRTRFVLWADHMIYQENTAQYE